MAYGNAILKDPTAIVGDRPPSPPRFPAPLNLEASTRPPKRQRKRMQLELQEDVEERLEEVIHVVTRLHEALENQIRRYKFRLHLGTFSSSCGQLNPGGGPPWAQ